MSQDHTQALAKRHDRIFKAVFERPEHAADMLRQDAVAKASLCHARARALGT